MRRFASATETAESATPPRLREGVLAPERLVHRAARSVSAVSVRARKVVLRLGDGRHGRLRDSGRAAGRGGAHDALALHRVEPRAERVQISDASRARARRGRWPDPRRGRWPGRAVARVEVGAQAGGRRRRGRAEAGLGRRGGLHERPAFVREGGVRQVLLVVRIGVGHGASFRRLREVSAEA